MITKLRVQNFKCLRDLSLEFSPLTVLIGPNDSGKTSILEALQLLGQTPEKSTWPGQHPPAVYAWNRDSSVNLSWEIEGLANEDKFSYVFEIQSATGQIVRDEFRCGTNKNVTRTASGGVQVSGASVDRGILAPDMAALAYIRNTAHRKGIDHAIDTFQCHQRLRLDPGALRKSSVPRTDAMLSATGDNLAAVLDAFLTGPDREAITQMEAALQLAIPTLRGLSCRIAPQGAPGEKTIEFVLAGNSKPPVTIPCDLVSDGAMLITAFLALAYGNTPEVLLIEEPENGLHPSILASVITLLRDISTGKVGNQPRQVILTTHSPLLLNYAEPEEIRIVRREADGTKVSSMTEVKGIKDLLREFGVGELWYLVGEEGLLKGKVP